MDYNNLIVTDNLIRYKPSTSSESEPLPNHDYRASVPDVQSLNTPSTSHGQSFPYPVPIQPINNEQPESVSNERRPLGGHMAGVQQEYPHSVTVDSQASLILVIGLVLSAAAVAVAVGFVQYYYCGRRRTRSRSGSTKIGVLSQLPTVHSITPSTPPTSYSTLQLNSGESYTQWDYKSG